MSDPSQEFVKLLMGKVYTGLKTSAKIAEFTQMTQTAARDLISDQLRGTLNSALAQNEARSGSQTEEQPSTDDPKGEDGIVTTEEELAAYYAVKSVLNGVIDVRRVFFRDAKTYASVLLDDSNRRPICRFRFDGKQKYLGLLDDEKVETRVPITDVDDIYQHVQALRAAVKRYDAPDNAHSG